MTFTPVPKQGTYELLAFHKPFVEIIGQCEYMFGCKLNKGNDEYLRYLWIQGLNEGNGERVYIATEAGLPILEARPSGQ